ncbi:circadian clock protein KaiA [Leptolyngbya sp. PCC 6406]|uniref:circadian clock protein KaiA n=1 Tax=Leptolyngbya sp. PCC 6406 TaxID=1173264 RepID=UPI0002AD09B8|nr:circadian clock protein KaiA [Leptolyngbya sp. PCC 6406]
MHSQLLIGSLIFSPELAQQLGTLLCEPEYAIHHDNTIDNFLQWIGENRHRVDCLLLESYDELQSLVIQLLGREILLPTVILAPTGSPIPAGQLAPDSTNPPIPPGCQVGISYHRAIACLPQGELSLLDQYIHQSIDEFLRLSHHQDISNLPPPPIADTRHFLLSLQQQRLSEKLRERLGYLGVYYKRNPQNFLRNLNPTDRAELVTTLKNEYRAIILTYFSDQEGLNQKIDDLVNIAFFADISVSQIVEVHMDLMDQFSKQLKLEGRSEEILLDYRLTLIDIIAHLCEMYRRSIPREK